MPTVGHDHGEDFSPGDERQHVAAGPWMIRSSAFESVFDHQRPCERM